MARTDRFERLAPHARPASRPLLGKTMLALALSLVSSVACAQAYTQSSAELRLGPGTDWTIVTELPPSTFVRIVGCDPRYRWCQVTVPHGLQGWLPGEVLRDVRDDQGLRRDGQGGLIDFPVIVFTGIQLGQPLVPGAAVQRRHVPATRPQSPDTPRGTAPHGGGEREPPFPGRGGPR